MRDTLGEPLAEGESVALDDGDAACEGESVLLGDRVCDGLLLRVLLGVWLKDVVGTCDRVELGVAVGEDTCELDMVGVCVRLGVGVDEGVLVGDRDGVPLRV